MSTLFSEDSKPGNSVFCPLGTYEIMQMSPGVEYHIRRGEAADDGPITMCEVCNIAIKEDPENPYRLVVDGKFSIDRFLSCNRTDDWEIQLVPSDGHLPMERGYCSLVFNCERPINDETAYHTHCCMGFILDTTINATTVKKNKRTNNIRWWM